MRAQLQLYCACANTWPRLYLTRSSITSHWYGTAMEAAVWTKLSSLSLPRGLSRLVRLGVPSVILLGLLGLAGWRWTRRRRGQLQPKTAAEEPPACGARAEGSVVPTPATHPGDSTQREQALVATSLPLLRSSAHHLAGPSVSSDVLSEGFSEALSVSSGVSDELAPLHTKPQRSHSTELIGKPIKRSSLIPTTASVPSFSSPHVQSPISPSSDGLYFSQLKNSPPTPAQGEGPKIKVAVQLPKDLVGRFIGKQGRNIKALMSESGAYIYVNQKNLPEDALEVPCHIQGSSTQIDHALKIVAAKFPTVDIPSWLDEGIASQSTNTSPGTPFASPLQIGGSEDWDIQLKPAGIPSASPFYAVVSFIESMTRVWLVPYESSSSLDDLHQQMSYYYCYTSSSSSSPPSLLASLNLSTEDSERQLIGKYCAVKVSDIHWLRGHVRKLSDDGGNYEVQLVDYGSTVIVPAIAIKPLM